MMTVQTSLLVAQSIDDIITLLNNDGFKYKNVEKKGNAAIFHTGNSIYESLVVLVNFKTSKEEIIILTNHLKDYIKRAPSENAPDWLTEEYTRGKRNLAKKLRIYAAFAPESLRMELEGYCSVCSKEISLLIENQSVSDTCTRCGMYRGDFVDLN